MHIVQQSSCISAAPRLRFAQVCHRSQHARCNQRLVVIGQRCCLSSLTIRQHPSTNAPILLALGLNLLQSTNCNDTANDRPRSHIVSSSQLSRRLSNVEVGGFSFLRFVPGPCPHILRYIHPRSAVSTPTLIERTPCSHGITVNNHTTDHGAHHRGPR